MPRDKTRRTFEARNHRGVPPANGAVHLRRQPDCGKARCGAFCAAAAVGGEMLKGVG